MITYRWGGVRWGNNVHVPVHTQASNLMLFLALQQTKALLFSDQLPVGWGGVG